MALSLGLSYYFYQANLDAFRVQTERQKTAMMRLVDSFVTHYSDVRSKFGSEAPVPATFRAHAIENFNKNWDPDHPLRLRMVGRNGTAIATRPNDPQLLEAIELLANSERPKAKTLITVQNNDGTYFLRSLFPSIASKEICVSCHNSMPLATTT